MSEQNYHQPSIRQRLVSRVLLISLGLLIIFLLIAYKDVHHETEELFDAQLARSARLILSMAQAEIEEGDFHDIAQFQRFLEGNRLTAAEQTISQEDDEGTSAGHYYESKLAFMVIHNNDAIVLSSYNAPAILTTARVPGYSTVADKDTRWRLFRLDSRQGNLHSITAERIDVRNDLVGKISSDLLILFVLLICVLGVVIWFAISSGLEPLRELASQIQSRNEDNLDAVNDSNVPKEVSAIVQALNRLFSRLGNALQRERHITSDAAHELRTPLAAVKLHAELARTSSSVEERDAALDNVIEGVNRSSHLVGQLLSLARLEPDASLHQQHETELAALVSDEIAEHAAMAAKKNIQLLDHSVDGSTIRGDVAALHLMLRNLLDNAIAYTQVGGTVQVSTLQQAKQVCLRVEDNGPGIEAADTQRVFERFYRLKNHDQPGCGIGLSIVARVVELHHASITLRPPESGKGLLVEVCFPSI